MAKIEWNDTFSVKVKELDEHHKKLINYINELQESMKLGKGKEIIGEIIDKLADYTKFHFSAEENYMTKFNDPGYEKHKEGHEYFVSKVEEFRNEIEKSTSQVSIQVLGFLIEWLLNHILNVDKKYSKLFNDNGLI